MSIQKDCATVNGKPALSDLTAFVAIVEHRSFRKAADALGLSPSTLSHMMRTLEENMGVRLLNRTTRSVSPSEAGDRFLLRLTPVLKDLDEALQEVDSYRGSPHGTMRINGSEPAVRLLLRLMVPGFLARYPGISLDLVSENKLVDIVGQQFDAGVRLGEAVPLDMIAVKVGGPVRFLAVASPAYLSTRGTPQTPDDLKHHSCIRVRMPSGKPYRWEFAKHGQAFNIDVPGALTLDHLGLMAEAAADGLGIAYVTETAAQDYLQHGQLVSVLDDWCPFIPGLFLYYPAGRHIPATLRAFIDMLRETTPQVD